MCVYAENWIFIYIWREEHINIYWNLIAIIVYIKMLMSYLTHLLFHLLTNIKYILISFYNNYYFSIISGSNYVNNEPLINMSFSFRLKFYEIPHFIPLCWKTEKDTIKCIDSSTKISICWTDKDSKLLLALEIEKGEEI